MNEAPWIEQLDAADKALNDCTMSFDHLKERLNPILERFKQSSFQPDIHSYVTLDAKIYEDKTYSMELHAKYFDTEMEIFLYPHHGQLDEAMRYLKSLNQLTGDLMDFIKRHDLRTPIVQD